MEAAWDVMLDAHWLARIIGILCARLPVPEQGVVSVIHSVGAPSLYPPWQRRPVRSEPEDLQPAGSVERQVPIHAVSRL